MVKIHTTLSIDSEVIKKAKSAFINMSQVAEDALKKRLGEREIIIDETIKGCEFCGKELEKATADNLNGLAWICPDEKWICPNCLKKKYSAC